MIGLQEVQKHCLANLAVRNHEGSGTVELYDDKERRRIALHNLKTNKPFYANLGPKFVEYRRRVEFRALSIQEPISFHMVQLPSGDERWVSNADELLKAVNEGFEITATNFKHNFGNPCGEVTLGAWQTANVTDRSGYQIGGSPYSKHLSPSQLRLIGRACWRRINVAARDSVIVEALPHIKISKSVMQKLQGTTVGEPARELCYAFYNQSRQPQWWQQLRSYRGGLRDATNLRMYAMIAAEYIFDALGTQSQMPNAWKTSTVIGLLRHMRDTEDFTPMPILADALQDAGCEDEKLLNHYRFPEASFSLASWIFRATGMI